MDRLLEVGVNDLDGFEYWHYSYTYTPMLGCSLPISKPYVIPTSPAERGRPWEPFKAIAIRLSGTNKTTNQNNVGKAYGRKQVSEGNTLDTVRGCLGGRTHFGLGCPWGC